jgi:F0F1-type ATP synthase alpha subunit
VARAAKIRKAFFCELALIDRQIFSIILTMQDGVTSLTVMGNDRSVEQGDLVERTFSELIICVGFSILGRVIDPLGNFLDSPKAK